MQFPSHLNHHKCFVELCCAILVKQPIKSWCYLLVCCHYGIVSWRTRNVHKKSKQLEHIKKIHQIYEWLQMFLVHLRTDLVCIVCCLPKTTWTVIIFNQRFFDSSLKCRWNAQNSGNCCFDIINNLKSIWFRSIETNLPIIHESNLFYCSCDNALITNFSLIRDIQNRN